MGKSVIKKLNDRIERTQKQRKQRIEKVGEENYHRQNMRRVASKAKAAITKGDSMDKAEAREAVKRVGEYKRGDVDPDTKPKKYARGGQVRGCGMARRRRGE